MKKVPLYLIDTVVLKIEKRLCHFFYTLFFLFFGIACTSAPVSNDSMTLVAGDSLTLSIDNSTYYESTSMFQFEENSNEYLSFLDTEYSQKIHIYDINGGKLVKTVVLQKEGKDGMTALSGCHPLSLNHFIVTSWNGLFGLVNGKGEIEKRFNFWSGGTNFNAFDHISFASYIYKPAIIKDSILYFSQSLLKHPRKKNDWDKIPVFSTANLSNGTFKWSQLCYPLAFDKDEEAFMVCDPEISYSYTGKEVVFSLGQYDSIFVSSDFKHKKAYSAKSRYLAQAHPYVQDAQVDLFKTIQILGRQPHYLHLMYDKYRDVFYRFALMPDDDIKPFSSNPQRKFSVIILDSQYKIVGEVLFPGNTYASHLCFVGKKGLYISENNENNPKFNENILTFKCFNLSSKK